MVKRAGVRRRLMVGAVVLAVAWAVVGSSPVPGAASPTSGAPGALLPPGTALNDGFVVAEGSALVGAVFPILRAPVQGVPLSGWTAQLVVDADPIAVFNAYVGQARALGYAMRGDCYVQRSGNGDVELRGYTGLDAQAVRCGAGYSRSSDTDPYSGVHVSVQLAVARDGAGDLVATGDIGISRVGDGSGQEPEYVNQPPLEDVTAPLPALPAIEVSPLATVGQPVAPDIYARVDIVVPVGSVLAAPPAQGADARCSLGYDAVMVVENVERVFADLGDQLESYGEGPSPVETIREQRDGVSYSSFTLDIPGGDDWFEVTSVESGSEALVLVSAC